MARIQLLPPEVISQIAAGEIIERPASIVKELVENSLDAGAGKIEVEIEQGGLDLIRVVDDGGGIYPEDFPLALTTHATSKLTKADDLFEIQTLGFRGEALASIASVSKFLLQSIPHDISQGAQVECNGGITREISPWSGSPGTRIEIRHIFYNAPVRRKFLKSAPAETAQITEMMTRLILARAGSNFESNPTQWTYRNNQKQVFHIPNGAKIEEVLDNLLGNSISKQLHLIDAKQSGLRLRGFIGSPTSDKSTSRSQYFFLNGRWFKDKTISHALQEGYRGHLMTGRYPVAFLFLELDPQMVDVNVHPCKTEVRFRDIGTIHHLVFQTVRNTILATNGSTAMQFPEPDIYTPIKTNYSASLEKKELTPILPHKDFALTNPLIENRTIPFPEITNSPILNSKENTLVATQKPNYEFKEPLLPNDKSTILDCPPAPKIVQIYNSYLVMETDDGILVVDQHALHERVLFEQLKKKFSEGELDCQKLLIPEIIEFPAFQKELILSQVQQFEKLGFKIGDFGGSSICLESFPALLGRKSPKTLLESVVNQLFLKDELPSREAFFHQTLSTIACHSAVRAGDSLSQEEMLLLSQMRHLSNSNYHCPHGRPTSLLISKNDLERQFGRLG